MLGGGRAVFGGAGSAARLPRPLRCICRRRLRSSQLPPAIPCLESFILHSYTTCSKSALRTTVATGSSFPTRPNSHIASANMAGMCKFRKCIGAPWCSLLKRVSMNGRQERQKWGRSPLQRGGPLGGGTLPGGGGGASLLGHCRGAGRLRLRLRHRRPQIRCCAVRAVNHCRLHLPPHAAQASLASLYCGTPLMRSC